MTRPTVDAVLMDSAELWSKRSTCSRLHVGAVAARGGRVIVSGYNGAVSGAKHCDHTCYCSDPPWMGSGLPKGQHTDTCKAIRPCKESVHAEANLVAFAAREGIGLYGSTVYTTHAPCVECARLLINAGIFGLTYRRDYRDLWGLMLLEKHGVPVSRFVEELGDARAED